MLGAFSVSGSTPPPFFRDLLWKGGTQNSFMNTVPPGTDMSIFCSGMMWKRFAFSRKLEMGTQSLLLWKHKTPEANPTPVPVCRPQKYLTTAGMWVSKRNTRMLSACSDTILEAQEPTTTALRSLSPGTSHKHWALTLEGKNKQLFLYSFNPQFPSRRLTNTCLLSSQQMNKLAAEGVQKSPLLLRV